MTNEMTRDGRAVQFGLIGPGKLAAQKLAPAMAEARGATLRSVLGRKPEETAAFARHHSASAFTDLAAFLADPELDAVLIAAPDRLHAEFAVAALASGRPTFVEKPMCSTVEGAWQVVDATGRAAVPAGICYHLRFHEGLRRMVEAAHAGAIGTPLHMRVQWTYRAAEGAAHWRARSEEPWWSLGAFGTHAVDLIRWFLIPLCGEVVQVRGLISGGVWGSQKDETAIGLLEFASGATAELLASVLFASESRVEVVGTKGSMTASGALNGEGTGKIEIGGVPLEYAATSPYVLQIEELARCVAERRAPLVDCIEGLRNVQILEEIALLGRTTMTSSKA